MELVLSEHRAAAVRRAASTPSARRRLNIEPDQLLSDDGPIPPLGLRRRQKPDVTAGSRTEPLPDCMLTAYETRLKRTEMFCILHISDLHRSQAEPMDNKSLVAALVADRDRYVVETPRVPPPTAIVVSGDLVEGAAIDAENWEESIREQYEVTRAFLNELCTLFLDGDKRRMILTPGNHDVCWNTSRQAMEIVPKSKYPNDVLTSLTRPGSNYRWSWHELKLYRIANDTIYRKRMDLYWEFVESFYKGAELQFPLERNRGFQLFDLYERRVLIAAFDSIDGNDCYNFAGSITPGSVGSCAIKLREVAHDYELQIALWHHSIQGPPLHSDYMESSHVQEMIAHGFQLGLHGHQHVAGTLTQYIHLDESRAMAVVGAGSLCAGVNQLPRGQDRQYNLIVIEDDLVRARVHVREMADGGQFIRKRSGAFLNGFVEVSWFPQTNVMGMKVDTKDSNDRRTIDAAEQALRSERPQEAIELLNSVDVDSYPHARAIFLNALLSEQRWEAIVEAIGTPTDIHEAVTLVTALIRGGRFDEAQDRLDSEVGIDAGTRQELQERLRTEQLMRQS